ncbi:small multi-drug export protein [Bacillus suaedae]|uniref:Small multi-drug export protein n=1 Tax=Halalkalibacter suaedae TaxID=2822140 RepID=A0A940WRZ0_9BACI|nr:small multi-drug export protein [Bacillus suaedae]MBP3950693.1 small multi-drug export protein [Bacillus suaedae]
MSFFEVLWAYLLVFVFSATPLFESIIVIPLGIFAGLSAIPVTIVALVGNLLTVYLVIVFVEQIKNWRNKRKKQEGVEKQNKRSERAKAIWKKYGLPGLAIIGPLFVGSHITALMGLSLGGSKKMVASWLTASLIFWCILAAILAHLGFDLFNAQDREIF